jgi:uncharacterized membrane protein
MTQLAVWRFVAEPIARRAELRLGRLAASQALLLQDGRIYAWPAAEARPSTRRIYSVPLTDALDDIGWGLLLGHARCGPDISEPISARGIGRELTEGLRAAVVPASSGLIVVGEQRSLDQIAEALASLRADFCHAVPAGGWNR